MAFSISMPLIDAVYGIHGDIMQKKSPEITKLTKGRASFTHLVKVMG